VTIISCISTKPFRRVIINVLTCRGRKFEDRSQIYKKDFRFWKFLSWVPGGCKFLWMFYAISCTMCSLCDVCRIFVWSCFFLHLLHLTPRMSAKDMRVCNAWPVRCRTYGYLPSRRASRWLVANYTAWWRGQKGVKNLLRVVTQPVHDWDRARDLLITTSCATTPAHPLTSQLGYVGLSVLRSRVFFFWNGSQSVSRSEQIYRTRANYRRREVLFVGDVKQFGFESILISWPTFTLLSLPLCLECYNRP